MSSVNDKLLSELSAEQRAKIQQKVDEKVASNILKIQQQQERQTSNRANSTSGLGLNIRKADDSISREATKRVKVRVFPTDAMGAAPLPEGYLAMKKSLNPSSSQAAAPFALSYHDRVRIAQESMPYTAPKEKTTTKKILRHAFSFIS